MYGSTLGGLGQQLTTAQNYGNTAGMNQASTNAMASTAQSYDAARQNNMRQLGSYGVDPSQMKSGALNLNANLAQAGAVGNAGYQAGQQRQLTGMGLVSNALNQNMMGSQVGQGYGAGANATGQNIAGIGNQTTQTSSGALTAPSTMLQTGLSGYGTSANIANQTFGNQLAQYNINQNNGNMLSSMIGQGVGMAAGAAAGHADGGAIPGRYANGGQAAPIPVSGVTPVMAGAYTPPQSQNGGGGGGGSSPMSPAMQGYKAGNNLSGMYDQYQANSMMPGTNSMMASDPQMQSIASGNSFGGGADIASSTGTSAADLGASSGVGAAAGGAGDAAIGSAAGGAAAGGAGAAVGGAAADAAIGTAAADAAGVIGADLAAGGAADALLLAANGGAIPQRKRPDWGNPAVQRPRGVPPQIGIPGPWVNADGGHPGPGPGMIQHGMSDGTGIDDQVHAKVSVGEYIIPADVVHAKGKEFFDKLLQRYHTPAAQQRQQMGMH